ncbi:MAG: protease inhibitor I42 family protein [Actinomycetes bacterium]
MTGQREDGQDPVRGEQSVMVVVGEEVVVTLADLPGAGYEWMARDLPDGLALVSSELVGQSPTTVGAARARPLRLRAELPGTYVLLLELVRPWEPVDVAPADTRSMTVTVLAKQ